MRQMDADNIPNRGSPSGIHGVEVVQRIFGEDDSIGHGVIVAYFWLDYNVFLDSAAYSGPRKFSSNKAINQPSTRMVKKKIQNGD